jgi:hypothetical protein
MMLSEGNIIANFETFRGAHGLQDVDIKRELVAGALDMLNEGFGEVYNSLIQSHDEDYIYCGHLVFCLLQTRPIIALKEKPPSILRLPVYQTLNESFALFNVLTLLNIKEGYIIKSAKKLDGFVAFLASHQNITTEALVKKLKGLRVPRYMPGQRP